MDLFLHSLTKYASGHGDVMGGAVIGSAELIRRLRPEFTLLGGVLDPHAAWLIQRGLKTYPVRYEAQSSAALRIAQYPGRARQSARVHYPGLARHARHELAARQMRHFGTIVSFDLRAGAAAGDRFADALQLFAIAASMGSPESLIIPPGLMGPPRPASRAGGAVRGGSGHRAAVHGPRRPRRPDRRYRTGAGHDLT